MTNSKTTRKALLSSALALTMCVAMLVATTFAWFTDTASTSVNKIQAGTLDVKLEYANNATGTGDDVTWTEVETDTVLKFLQKSSGSGASTQATGTILWEPGCTYQLPALRISNEGNLALKYKIIINGIAGDAKLNDVIDWTIKNDADESNGTDLANAEYHLTAKDSTNASDILTIQGHMQETAGNEYQGLSIDGISITVVATQDTVEYDSTRENYDEDAPTVKVSDEEELRTALYNNPYAKIVLENDITLKLRYDAGTSTLKDSDAGDTLSNYKESTNNSVARLVVKEGQYVVLDLNGHTIARNENATQGNTGRTDTDLIANFGILTITDSSTGGTKGTLKGSGFTHCGGAVLHNYGEKAVLTVEKINVFGNAAAQTTGEGAGTGQNSIINGDPGSDWEDSYTGGTVIIDGAKVYDENSNKTITASLVKNLSGTMIIKGNASLSSTKALGCDSGTIYVKSGSITGTTYAIKAEKDSTAAEAVVEVATGVTIYGEVKAVDGGKIVGCALSDS